MTSNTETDILQANVYINDLTEKIQAWIEMGVSKLTPFPIMEIRSHKDCNHGENKQLMALKLIEDNFYNLTFGENICEFSIKENLMDKKVKIEFDRYSRSAFNKFKEQFEINLKKKDSYLLYDNGNLKYDGQVVDGKESGKGTLFYKDTFATKYAGEFENGEFDGVGIFFNKSGSMRIEAYNIADGIPNRSGKILIDSPGIKKEILFEWDRIYKYHDMVTKTEKKEFVSDNYFVESVCEFLLKGEHISLDTIRFLEKDVGEQNRIIHQEIENLKVQNKELININHLILKILMGYVCASLINYIIR